MTTTICTHCRQAIIFDGLEVSVERQTIAWNGETLRVIPKTAMILHLLATQKGRVLRRTQATAAIWDGPDGGPLSARNCLDVHITRARVALRAVGAPFSIVASRGIGHTLKRNSDDKPEAGRVTSYDLPYRSRPATIRRAAALRGNGRRVPALLE